MTLAGFLEQHPYRGSLLFLLIMIFVLVAAGGVSGFLALGTLEQLAAGDLLLAATGMLLLSRLGWWDRAGYSRWIRLRHVPLFLFPVAVALLPLANGIVVTEPVAILGFLGLTLAIGFAEETFFRGLILSTLEPAGIFRAAAVSALLFAVPHLLNALAGVWDLAFTAADMIAAFGIGVTFAALRFRTGSILPLIGLHALFDFSSLLSLGGIVIHAQTLPSLFGSGVAGLIFVAYGFFLLRKVPAAEERKTIQGPVPDLSMAADPGHL